MSDFKTRLIEEQAQLEEKLNKLDVFLMSGKAKEIDSVQRTLLKVQSSAMNTYLQCLNQRIERIQTQLTMTKIRAKFECEQIQDQPSHNHKTVSFYPVLQGSEENKSFAKYTPGGSLHLIISYDTPACDAFEQGKEYYLDITPSLGLNPEDETYKTVQELIENKDHCPLPLDVIPNYMGINLCSVEAISWKSQSVGQLTSLSIHFLPDNDPPKNQKIINNAEQQCVDVIEDSPIKARLKAYIGCKIIQAIPMSKEKFYTKVKNNPDDNSEDADGYMVVYPDGYKSWSPKRVFEEAYREVSPQEKELIG